MKLPNLEFIESSQRYWVEFSPYQFLVNNIEFWKFENFSPGGTSELDQYTFNSIVAGL